MLHTISLDDMDFRCTIGIRPRERARRQPVRIAVALEVDLPAAAPELSIEQTVDYSALYARLRTAVERSAFGLVESLAAHVAELCLRDPRVGFVTVTVTKPRALRRKATVGVTVARSRGDGTEDTRGHGTSNR